MYKATFQLLGVTDLMFGQRMISPKKDSETFGQWEERCWKEKVRLTEKGQVCLSPFAVTNALVAAAKWLKRKVDGRSGFAGRFQSGVAPSGPVLLFRPDGSPMRIRDVEPVLLFVPSGGQKGQGTRVDRIFPTVHEWRADGAVMVFDGKISGDQLRDHLVAVGQYVGFGSMRVEGGGINGRFMVEAVDCEDLSIMAEVAADET